MTLDSNGVPAYDIKEGVAWDNIPFTPELEALAKDTQAVCFGSLAQRSVVSRDDPQIPRCYAQRRQPSEDF